MWISNTKWCKNLPNFFLSALEEGYLTLSVISCAFIFIHFLFYQLHVFLLFCLFFQLNSKDKRYFSSKEYEVILLVSSVSEWHVFRHVLWECTETILDIPCFFSNLHKSTSLGPLDFVIRSSDFCMYGKTQGTGIQMESL